MAAKPASLTVGGQEPACTDPLDRGASETSARRERETVCMCCPVQDGVSPEVPEASAVRARQPGGRDRGV